MESSRTDVIFRYEFPVVMLSAGRKAFSGLKNKKHDPDAVNLFMANWVCRDTEKVVAKHKAGATDYTKPWEKEKLLATLSAALKP